MENAITPNDKIITAYRAHGWTYVRGATPHQVLAELTGLYTMYPYLDLELILFHYCIDFP